MPERRRIDPRPNAAPVGHDNQEPPFRHQHPPEFSQKRSRPFRCFQAVNKEQPVEAIVRQRQMLVLNEHAGKRTRRRPYERPLRLRHQRGKARRLRPERPEIGHTEPEPAHGPALQSPPAVAHLTGHDPPHGQPERCLVEIPEIDDIEIHGVSDWACLLPARHPALLEMNRIMHEKAPCGGAAAR